MNSDIAHAAAYRPADGRRMAANKVLNAFDTELRAARMDYPVHDIVPSPLKGRSSTSRALSRQHAVACARVVARLHEIGVQL